MFRAIIVGGVILGSVVGIAAASWVLDPQSAAPNAIAVVEPAKPETAPCNNATHAGTAGNKKCAKGPRHKNLKPIQRIDRAEAEYSDEGGGYDDNEAPPIGDE